MTQLGLFSAAPPAPAKPEPPTLEQRFQAFHRENPHVFVRLLELARARLDRGETFISVKALWEQLRVALATNADEYRLNNSYTALYSRLLLEVEPRLVGVIEIRKRKAK